MVVVYFDLYQKEFVFVCLCLFIVVFEVSIDVWRFRMLAIVFKWIFVFNILFQCLLRGYYVRLLEFVLCKYSREKYSKLIPFIVSCIVNVHTDTLFIKIMNYVTSGCLPKQSNKYKKRYWIVKPEQFHTNHTNCLKNIFQY